MPLVGPPRRTRQSRLGSASACAQSKCTRVRFVSIHWQRQSAAASWQLTVAATPIKLTFASHTRLPVPALPEQFSWR
jgi:hypothetical protein